MKTPVTERDATKLTWYIVDEDGYTPNNLEAALMHLIKSTFAYDDAEVISDIAFVQKEQTEIPKIVCSMGEVKVDPVKGGLVGTGYGVGVNPGEDHNKNRHARMIDGSVSFNCTAKCAAEARDLAYNLLEYLLTLSYYLPEMMCGIKSFLPTSLGKVKKIEDNEHLWSCTVSCVYSVEIAWNTERLAPRLKRFDTRSLNTIVFEET